MFGTLIKKVFGDKATRDLKEATPIVELTNTEFVKLAGLSNDELRGRTATLKARIAERTKESDDKVVALRNEIEADPHMDIQDREQRYEEIDKILEQSVKDIEGVLLEILPEAFAVVKETARRFKENKEIRVRATDMDRELATKRQNEIRIEGDQAIWKNSWMAAGVPVTW